jgi:hypothetical protein
MFSSNNPLPFSTEDDLLDLISNKVSEGKTIEYKLMLPGNSDDDKREFLADVSSFANTAGGHLIFGMDENQGVASNLIGISELDSDKEKLRLENIIRDGIGPRIAGISIQPVQLQNKNSALVIHIPNSWLSPHMVTYRGTSRFFARNSAGKYQLDVHEIRQAFLLSEGTAERIKNYRLDRLVQINAGNTPIPIRGHAKLVMHVIPVSAFQANESINIQTAARACHSFFADLRFSSRFNLEGILLFIDFRDGSPPPEYMQIYRQSHIEYVSGYMLDSSFPGATKNNSIPITDVETDVVKIFKNILDYQQSLGVETPTVLSLNFLQVKGFVFGTPSRLRVESAYHNHGIDRDDLILPEILIDNYPKTLEETARNLKPIFDSIWNAAGWPQSINFDENGNWKPRRDR